MPTVCPTHSLYGALIRPLLEVLYSKCVHGQGGRGHKKLDSLLSEIKLLETHNKNASDKSIANKLTKLRSDLSLLLLEQYDKHIQSLKLAHYSSGNRDGKFLAQRLKDSKAKTNIPNS